MDSSAGTVERRIPNSKHSSSNSSVVNLNRTKHQDITQSIGIRAIYLLLAESFEESCLVYCNGRHVGECLALGGRAARMQRMALMEKPDESGALDPPCAKHLHRAFLAWHSEQGSWKAPRASL